MFKEFISQKKMETASRIPDFTRIKTGVNEKKARGRKKAQRAPEVPEDVYRKCSFCGKPILNRDVRDNLYRCPKCGGYFRVHARRRVELIADKGSFEEFDRDMPIVNPLDFPGYEDKLKLMQEKTGLSEAVITGRCTIDGEAAVLCVMDNRFIMSSMGQVVGEKLTRAIERSDEEQLPLIIYCASGGARMQEGIVSLMQMTKTSQAIKRHRDKGLLYISVLTNPTMGGVTASFAMLGDVILAEPKALIGFAGPRVIEQTIGEKLPEGFQHSEFLLDHGFVDIIAGREEQKELIAELIRAHDMEKGRKRFKAFLKDKGAMEPRTPLGEGDGQRKDMLTEAEEASERRELSKPKEDGSSEGDLHQSGDRSGLSAWDRVKLSRAKDRPRAMDYVDRLFDGFIELHGDRRFGDDPAIAGGVALFHGLPVTVIAQQKGKDTKDNLRHNFGMPKPEGYRKALRLMKEAEAFGRPVICFVDTPGAYPGISSEERGQGEAIAECIAEMACLKVPAASVIISEGGSGGALAMASANEIYMLENATYSILSPEGFASILYKDPGKAREASEIMRITAEDLKKLGIIDAIIPEPEGLCEENLNVPVAAMEERLMDFISRSMDKSGDEIERERFERFRSF